MGRAVRLGRTQLAPDVRADPDYVPTLPGILTELAVPLRVGRMIVGALNIESERALPDGAANLIRPLAAVLGTARRTGPRHEERSICRRSLASSSTSEASEIRTRSPRSLLRLCRVCFRSR